MFRKTSALGTKTARIYCFWAYSLWQWTDSSAKEIPDPCMESARGDRTFGSPRSSRAPNMEFGVAEWMEYSSDLWAPSVPPVRLRHSGLSCLIFHSRDVPEEWDILCGPHQPSGPWHRGLELKMMLKSQVHPLHTSVLQHRLKHSTALWISQELSCSSLHLVHLCDHY